MSPPTTREELLEAYMAFMAVQLTLLPPKSSQELLQQLQRDCAAIHTIMTTRYLNPRIPVPKAGQLHLAWEYAKDPAHHHRFVNMLRVSPRVFDTILDLIEGHAAFQNNSNCPQAPVRDQLAITFYRMGRYGNGSSITDVARMSGYSEGAVELFTDRCLDALMSLHDIFVRPLTDDEKEVEKRYIEEKLGFEGSSWREGWIMYDGTIIVLYARPGLDGASYYTRKCNYGLNCQVFLFSVLIHLL